MYDTNNNSFKFTESPTSVDSLITYEFRNYNGDLYLAYFDVQDGLAELAFENSNRRGYNIFISDGYVTEKLNTCKEMCLHFMRNYGDGIDAIWWQATPSRFKVYERYFQSQGNLIPDLPHFGATMLADNYGVSGMVREESKLNEIAELYHG